MEAETQDIIYDGDIYHRQPCEQRRANRKKRTRAKKNKNEFIDDGGWSTPSSEGGKDLRREAFLSPEDSDWIVSQTPMEDREQRLDRSWRPRLSSGQLNHDHDADNDYSFSSDDEESSLMHEDTETEESDNHVEQPAQKNAVCASRPLNKIQQRVISMSDVGRSSPIMISSQEDETSYRVRCPASHAVGHSQDNESSIDRILLGYNSANQQLQDAGVGRMLHAAQHQNVNRCPNGHSKQTEKCARGQRLGWKKRPRHTHSPRKELVVALFSSQNYKHSLTPDDSLPSDTISTSIGATDIAESNLMINGYQHARVECVDISSSDESGDACEASAPGTQVRRL